MTAPAGATPLPVWETQACIVTPCIDVDLPGYMILRPRVEATRLLEAPAFAAELGETLGMLEAAILQVVSAPRLYVLRFSEAQASVHFHLFPRTPALSEAYRQAFAHPAANVIGPELFEWARATHLLPRGRSLGDATLRAAEAIRNVLRDARRASP